jgi:hypothetical protein
MPKDSHDREYRREVGWVSPHIQADHKRAPRGIAPGQLATTGVLSRPASSLSPRLSLAHGITCNFLVKAERSGHETCQKTRTRPRMPA